MTTCNERQKQFMGSKSPFEVSPFLMLLGTVTARSADRGDRLERPVEWAFTEIEKIFDEKYRVLGQALSLDPAVALNDVATAFAVGTVLGAADVRVCCHGQRGWKYSTPATFIFDYISQQYGVKGVVDQVNTLSHSPNPT